MEKKIILLVEADILIRHPLAEYLRGCDYLVIEAIDAQEARLVIDKGERSVDVALLDISEETGRNFALAGWMRENRPEIEVLRAGTIGRAVDQAQELCSEQPDLQRPYDHKLVADRIRRLLAERQRRTEDGKLLRQA
jgi:DNA-binding NtrC family response regulator